MGQKRHRRLKLRGEREEEHGFVETGLEQCACRRKSERRDSWREQAPGREPFPCGRPSPSPSSLPKEENNASIGRLYFDVHSDLRFGNILGQSVSNAEFASRARDLERKGVSTFDVGSTMDVLLEGDAGFEVEELQRYLQEEGFYTSSYGVTGYFGPITKQALIKWQKANGVLATGNFGGMSRAKYLDLQEQKLQGKKSGKKVSLFGGRKKKVKAPPKRAKRVAASSPSDVKTKSTKSFGKKSSQQVVSVSQPQTLQKDKVRKGISWGTTLVFFVTLVVCWQTFSMYYKQKEERKLERQRMERDRE